MTQSPSLKNNNNHDCRHHDNDKGLDGFERIIVMIMMTVTTVMMLLLVMMVMMKTTTTMTAVTADEDVVPYFLNNF